MPYPMYAGYPSIGSMGTQMNNPMAQQLSMMPQQMPPQMAPQVNPTPATNVINNKIWVQGEAGAKSYLVAPNTDVTLWDSEAQVIYLKAADASGLPSMKILDYTIRGAETPKMPLEPQPAVDLTGYVLKSDFDALKEELEALKEEVKHVPKQMARKKGGEE